MQQVYHKTKSAATSLEKFMGEGAHVVKGRDIIISNYVNAQLLAVSYEGDNLPEEQGQLFVYPIDDEKFCLQLCYLLHPNDTTENSTVYSITYLPAFFEQFAQALQAGRGAFDFQKNTEVQFFICAKSSGLLIELGKNQPGFTPLTASLQAGQHALGLLARALESIAIPFTVCQVPACRFLAHDSERGKIEDAVLIITNQPGKPHTIKELARKVAMNECYLKKGFKAITGKTIHEYQQELRINKAKELLQKDGYSVTAAAFELGYSSIAHFSTAFKRVTGLKPCELLA